ncbi:MAG: DUF72 domain-containing protein [Desulfobacteraceae bacterium]|nr:MAG: DUF72 domain-containing protein [Desulfobacteraceae bacterium]
MMSEILIGTSGYYYDDWQNGFYPANTLKTSFLTYYSDQFRAVELNFTYYRMPTAPQLESMIAKSGGRLIFVIKTPKELTHDISADSLKKTLPLFMKNITPLIRHNLLGAILVQLPQSFHYTDENRVYLRELLLGLSPHPVVVEFRQKEWLKESVYQSLTGLGAGFVCVDEPDLPALLPPLCLATSRVGYLRFHGRNKKAWYGTDATRRYDYLYSEEELRAWVPKIKALAEKTDKVFAFFNNHAKAQAPVNARMLINLLAS